MSVLSMPFACPGLRTRKRGRPFGRPRRALRCAACLPAAVGLVDAVGLDLLLAELLGDLLLLGDGVLVEAHALLRDHGLLDDGLLGAERDLVLLLRQLGAV